MEKKKILLVDDDPDITSTLKIILESRGFSVDTAANKNEGTVKVDSFLPDLIVLDVNMTTRYEGFEMNKEVRMNEKFGNKPIIMLTGIDTVTVNQQVLDMYRSMKVIDPSNDGKVLLHTRQDNKIGVDYTDEKGVQRWVPTDSFLSKPVEPDVLINEINSLFSQS